MTQTVETKPVLENPELEALRELLQRAQRGDGQVLPALRAALDRDSRLWQHYGDLALQAECSLVTATAGNNQLLAESLVRKLAAMKTELVGPSATPLERLLS